MLIFKSFTFRILITIGSALFLGAFITAFLLLGYETKQIETQIVEELKLHAQNDANQIAYEIQSSVENSIGQARVFSRLIKSNRISRDLADDIIKQIADDHSGNIGVWAVFKTNCFDGKSSGYANTKRYGKSGAYSVWFHNYTSNVFINEWLTDFEEESWYKIINKTQTPFVTEPYIYQLDSSTNLFLITTSAPIIINNQIWGYSGIDIDDRHMAETLEDISTFYQGNVHLISPAGVCVIHSLNGREIKPFQGSNAAHRDFSQGEMVITNYFSFQQGKMLELLWPIRIEKVSKPWFLSISIPYKIIDQKIEKYRWNLILIFIFFTGLILIIISVTLYFMIRPVIKITGNLENIASHGCTDAVALKVKSQDEIGALTKSYNKLLESLKQKAKSEQELVKSTEALRQSELLSRVALGLTKSGTWYIDLKEDPDKVYLSENLFKIMGIKGSSGIDQNHKSLAWFSQNVLSTNKTLGKRALDFLHEAIADPQLEYNCCFQFTRENDGKVIWLTGFAEVERDSAGNPIYVFGVNQDITSAKNMQDQLTKAKEVADAANLAKSNFLSNMSHEIRTPMNAIIGFSEILNRRIKDDLSKRYLGLIQTSSKTLLDLINDILDFSKIEAGKLKLTYQPVNLVLMLNEIKSIFELQVQSKGLDFKLYIPDEIPEYIEIDELRLRQILMNLLSNSLKFTQAGFIKVTAEVQPEDYQKGTLVLAVEDSGIGIAKENQELIFGDFTQEEENTTRKYGGTGLGLSITKKIVGLLGGNIMLESEAGKGSLFIVRIPNIKIYPDKSDAFEKIT